MLEWLPRGWTLGFIGLDQLITKTSFKPISSSHKSTLKYSTEADRVTKSSYKPVSSSQEFSTEHTTLEDMIRVVAEKVEFA